MEGLFLSKAGPKSVCSSYLIAIIRKQSSDMCKIALISVRYDKHPLFGPAFIKIKPSTTRPKQGFIFWTAKLILSVDLFLASCTCMFPQRSTPVDQKDMFTSNPVLKGKDRPGTRHDYEVW